MSFIIDPNNASFSNIRQDLLDFLESAPDSEKWKDFFDSGIGQTVVDLVAGLGTFLTYNSVVARREALIQFANNRSSLIGASQTLGYSTFRGRNQTLRLTVTPNFNGVLSKFSVIGTLRDKDLVLLEDTLVNEGVSTTLDVVIGVTKDETLTVPDEGPKSFRFSQQNVSEDVRVLLNNVEVEISDRILDLINEKFVTQSNPFGSVDVKYLNLDTFTTRYDTGDSIKLEWIELAEVQEFTLSNLSFDFGTLSAFETLDIFKAVETSDSIKVNAPTFNETQFIVRGRDDFLKTFKLLSTTLADTNGRDVSGAVIELTYVNEDLSILTSVEKESFSDQIQRPFGVSPALFADPSLFFLDLDLELTLSTSISGDPDSTVRTELEKYEKKLGIQIDFETIEENLESQDFIRIARIKLKADDRANDTPYLLGQMVVPTGSPDPCGDIIFEATRLICRSGDTEPSCPSAVGDLIVDNKVEWIAKDPVALGICDVDAELSLWAAQTDYQPGDRVRLTGPCDFILEFNECVNLSNQSQETQLISFSDEPASGTWRIESGVEVTSDLAFNADATDVQNALNALDQFTSVEVSGNYLDGFTCVLDPNVDFDEFTFLGDGQNEIQCLQPNLIPNAGSFQLQFGGFTTAPLSFNESAANVQSALEGLTSIGAGNVEVTGGMSTRYLVEFINDLELSDQADIVVLNNTLVSTTSVAGSVVETTPGRPVDAGQNEIQDITFSQTPTNGSWSLTFDGQTTELLNETADATDVEEALEDLASITPGEISVSGSFAAGFTAEFQNALGNQDVSLIEVATSLLTFDQAISDSIATIQEGGGGPNEVQEIKFDFVPDAGQWKITFDGEETDLLAFDANNLQVRDALVNLSNIGTDISDQPNIEVSGDYANGFVLTFINDLANTNVAEVTVSFNTLTIAQAVDISVAETTPGRPVDAGEDEVQDITFDFEPDSGNWKLDFDGEETSSLSSASAAIDIQNALNALTALSAVTVSGSFAAGFTVTFAGADGKIDQPLLEVIDNTLGASSADVTFDTCAEAQDGQTPSSNLKDGVGDPISITPSTPVGGSNPEPSWPGTAECPIV